jgi:predicted Kef-type K+ transport protein
MSGRILKKDTELHFVIGLTGLATFGGLGVANMFDVSMRKESVIGIIVLVAAMQVSLLRMDQRAVEETDGHVQS